MTAIQENIKKLVERYKLNYADEYFAVIENIKKERAKQFNDSKFKKTDLLERALYTIPENLLKVLVAEMDEEDTAFYNSRKGAIWFAKTFPEFSLVNKV